MLRPILPHIEAQVVDSLRRRGIRRDAAHDAFDESLVRLYAARPDLRGPPGLARWLSLVSFRAAERDRKRASSTTPCSGRGTGAVLDTALVVEHRLALEAALEELRELRADERMLILEASLGRDDDERWRGQEGRRLRLRLHRARQRLRRRMRGWLAGFPLLRWPARRGPGVPGPSAMAGASMVALMGVVSVMGASLRSRSDAGPVPSISPGALASFGTEVAAPSAAPSPPAMAAPAAPAGRSEEPARGGAPTAAAAPMGIRVEPLSGSSTAAAARDREEGDRSLLCYGNVPVLGDRCIEHPIRGSLPGR